MGLWFWILMGTVLTITLTTPFLIAFVMLLVPGPKGKLRQMREATVDGLSPQQAKELFTSRLSQDGFTLELVQEPLRLRASKKQLNTVDADSHIHQAIIIELVFQAASSGASVTASASMKDFVFYDSGETRKLQAALERLLYADPTREPVPSFPSRSFGALCALVTPLLSIGLMILLLARGRSTSMIHAFVFTGCGLSCLASVFLARQAMIQIRRRPTEITGIELVVATLIFASVGMVLCGVGIYFDFREPFVTTLKHSLGI